MNTGRTTTNSTVCYFLFFSVCIFPTTMSVLIVSLRGVSDGASSRTTPKEARGKGRLQYKLDEASLSSKKDGDDDKTLSSNEYDGDDELASEGEDDDDARTNTHAVDTDGKDAAEQVEEKEEEDVPALEHIPLTLDEYIYQQSSWEEFQSLFFENQKRQLGQQETIDNLRMRQIELEVENSLLKLNVAELKRDVDDKQNGFNTLQAGNAHAYQTLEHAHQDLEDYFANAHLALEHARQTLDGSLVFGQAQGHRRELAQEQENNNQGSNNNYMYDLRIAMQKVNTRPMTIARG